MFRKLLEPSLKYEVFQRSKTRENLANGIFSDAKESINWLNRILITLFFTPVVGITDILAKNSIIVLGSISVAISYLANFTYRLIQEDASAIEILLNLFGISIAISLAVLLTPGTLPLIYNLSGILFLINVAATGVNSYFLIRDVLLPPIYTIIKEIAYKLFNIKITDHLYKRKEFTLDDDYDVLFELTRRDYGVKLENNPSNPDTKEKIKTFNNLLNKLVAYLNKYNQQFFGNVRNQSQIDQIEKIIKEVAIECKTNTAYERLNKKITFKQCKIDRLRTARRQISVAASKCEKNKEQCQIVNFNRTLRMYINMPYIACVNSTHSIAEVKEAKSIADKLISSEINNQSEKIELLNSCLPPQKRREL